MATEKEVKKFLKAQIEALRGLEGFVMGLMENMLVDDVLVAFITHELLANSPGERLIAFTHAAPEDEDEGRVMLCTNLGIYVITVDSEGIFTRTTSYGLDYLIPFSEIDSIDYGKTGIFEPEHHLYIYQKDTRKKRGWFFTGTPQGLLYFQNHARNALLNYDESDAALATAPDTSDRDLDALEKRIRALLNQKLISASDCEIKIKKLRAG